MTRPVVQLAVAAAVMLGGAWLIAWWAVGVVLVVIGVLLGVDAVLRDDGNELADRRLSKQQLSDDVLERYRRAR
jgi:ABC-type transport system involved in cytochrome bd biosynthesis fused ATPase/permease subunit